MDLTMMILFPLILCVAAPILWIWGPAIHRKSPPHQKPGKPVSTKRGERLTAYEMSIIEEEKCPDCLEKDTMQAGPCGGMSQNFTCSHCQARFNVMGPFGVERISPRPLPAPPPVTKIVDNHGPYRSNE